jgi:hypothetical protein
MPKAPNAARRCRRQARLNQGGTDAGIHINGRKAMAKRKSEDDKHQIHEAGSEALEAAQAKEAGAKFEWHYGRVTRLGHYEIAGGRGVAIVWEEGGVTSQQGDISEEQWEIFRLAFKTTGRIAVLSDEEGEGWMYDYRFLEAVR